MTHQPPELESRIEQTPSVIVLEVGIGILSVALICATGKLIYDHYHAHESLHSDILSLVNNDSYI